MRISERFERQESEDIILMAELLEQEPALLVELMIQNFINMELSNSRSDAASADRKLGRLEAYRTILDDIQAFRSRKKELQRPVTPDTFESFDVEDNMTSPARGGEI